MIDQLHFDYLINSISLLGCAFVFLGVLRTKGPKTAALKLILLISFADSLGNVINFLNYRYGKEKSFCSFSMAIRVFSAWSGLFWGSAISLLVYYAFGERGASQVEKRTTKVIAFCSVVSITIALLPIFNFQNLTYEFDEDTKFCGLVLNNKDDEEETEDSPFILFLLLQLTPFLMAVIITVSAYVRAKYFIQSLPSHIIKTHNLDSWKLLIYPTALLLIYFPNILYSFMSLVLDDLPSYFLVIASNLYNLAGFINFLVYGLQFSRKKKFEEITEDGYLSDSFLNITEDHSEDHFYKGPHGEETERSYRKL